MQAKAIRNGLKAVLDGGSLGVTVTYPNVEAAAGQRPRVEVSIPDAEQFGGTVKGNEVQYEEGTLLCVAVTEHGTGENAGLDLADSVAALFPEGSTISITGGTIYIMARPSIRGGFADEAEYRVPVAISYRAKAD